MQGFHLVQSFAPGEISPELAHQIGMEFADRLLGGKFQAVVSTHLNTKCIHNHIVWNSVSMENGKSTAAMKNLCNWGAEDFGRTVRKAPPFRHPYREIGTGSPSLCPVAGRTKRYPHMENAHPERYRRSDCRFPHMEAVPAGDGKTGLCFPV